MDALAMVVHLYKVNGAWVWRVRKNGSVVLRSKKPEWTEERAGRRRVILLIVALAGRPRRKSGSHALVGAHRTGAVSGGTRIGPRGSIPNGRCSAFPQKNFWVARRGRPPIG